MKRILFLCTGNYYRSRFAEVLFNHITKQRGIDAVADSAALRLQLGSNNVGPLSQHARRNLEARGITLPHFLRFPRPVTEKDFSEADKVIALRAIEHRPMVEKFFHSHSHHVQFWDIGDVGDEDPDAACTRIADRVESLVSELQNFENSGNPE